MKSIINYSTPTALAKCLLGATMVMLPSLTLAADADYQKIDKELKIMSRIFETSLAEHQQPKVAFPGSRTPRARYLAHQGMLFEFSFGGDNVFYSDNGWEALGAGIGNLVGNIANEVGNALQDIDIEHPSPVVPVAPVAPSAPMADEWAENFSEAFEQRMEAYTERMEALEQMRDAQSEQRDQVRDLQREIRDLERSKRHEEESSAKMAKLQEELKQKQSELNQQMKKYQEQMDAYRQKRDEERSKSVQAKADAIVATLCDYGTTLRSLENDEYVTLVFSNFAGREDQIYVFKANNVKSCDSPKELLDDAIRYQL